MAELEAAPSEEVQLHVARNPAPVPPAKRSANALEKLEFVKALGLDPVQESEMIWIAEEAFHAQLPPGWQQHADEHGRAYFHNEATDESCWQHPMEALFKQIVEYWRRVHSTGGFWEIEDELQDIEDQIGHDLSDWMELYDEHGEKFYFHQRSEESRFDDPRNAVYHDLYARIRMVAKMKERLPLLARKPRPEDPVQAEMQLKRLQEEEQQRYMESVTRIQSAARALFAMRRCRALRKKRLIDKGAQPLKHRIELRIEKVPRGAKREIVLSETSTHRRFKAAQRIQARARGMRVRKHLCPIVAHRKFLNQKVVYIQRNMREILGAKREVREKEERLHRAATVIQCVVRGRKARRYAQTLRAERARYAHTLKCVVKMQSLWRMALGLRGVRRRKAAHEDRQVAVIQKFAKVFLAQREIIKGQQELEPFEVIMVPTQNAHMRRSIPWSWQLIMHPLDKRGHACDRPYQSQDLFENVGPSSWRTQAAVKIQAGMRGKLAKLRAARRRLVKNWAADEIVGCGFNLYATRRKAATTIQKRIRGFFVRRLDLISQLHQKWLEKVTPAIQETQAHMLCLLAQKWLLKFTDEGSQEQAAIFVQARWRGWWARRQVGLMREEWLWPMKGWFEYTGMGLDSVRVHVQFFGNPRFDEFKHFCEHGAHEDRIERMDEEIGETQQKETTKETKKTKETKETHAHDAKKRKKKEAHDNVKKNAEEANKRREDRMPSGQVSKTGSKGSAQQTQEPERAVPHQHHSGASAEAKSAEGDAVAKPVLPPSEKSERHTAPQKDQAKEVKATKAKAKAAKEVKANAKAGSRSGSPKPREERNSPKTPEHGHGGWSPRRGHLSNAVTPARERVEKDRPQPKEHPLVERSKSLKALESDMVTSPMAKMPSRPGSPSKARGSPLSQPGSPSQTMGSPPNVFVTPKSEAELPAEPMAETRFEDKAKPKTQERTRPTLAEGSSQKSQAQLKKKSKEVPEAAENGSQAKMLEEPPRAPQGLQEVAVDGAFSSSSRANAPLPAPWKHAGNSYAHGQSLEMNTQNLDDLTEEERVQAMADIVEERKRKVEELVRRQKKHAARRRKEQLLEAEKLGHGAAGDAYEEEHRKQKVRELKNLLKQKDGGIQGDRPAPMPMDRLRKAPAKVSPVDKLERDHQELRERRARVADRRRTGMTQSMATTRQRERVVHRHVHHHVHYHDGASGDESDDQTMQYQPPAYMVGGKMGMLQSASAGALRSAPFGTDGRVVTQGMPWRPLVHSASAGLDRTMAAFPAPPPGAAWPQQHLQGVPRNLGGPPMPPVGGCSARALQVRT